MMNILQQALSVIPPQEVRYTAIVGTETNDIGLVTSTKAVAKNLRGSFQPVDRSLYSAHGLDYQKRYYTFYTSENFFDVYRDVSGDLLFYDSRNFKILSRNDWFAYDGWVGVLCVEINDE